MILSKNFTLTDGWQPPPTACMRIFFTMRFAFDSVTQLDAGAGNGQPEVLPRDERKWDESDNGVPTILRSAVYPKSEKSSIAARNL